MTLIGSSGDVVHMKRTAGNRQCRITSQIISHTFRDAGLSNLHASKTLGSRVPILDKCMIVFPPVRLCMLGS
jgi:hypothetical protein